jgi:alkanesulfonate monooxygenase SsuD/methylene tetrahydromethanopterin reductase-like flavin-dependent oxidoreductase (luciferase family)
MKFGIVINPQHVKWETMRDVFVEADELGFDSAWVCDHLLAYTPDFVGSIFEAWTLLAALAGATTRIRIGSLVTNNGFRNPALLAKMAATADHISNGRLTLGLGSGNGPGSAAAAHAHEYIAYGLPLLSLSERTEMLVESCQILQGLWADGKFTFDGKHYQVDENPCDPVPVQRPGIPLLIGGVSEKYTLPTAARFASIWSHPLFGENGCTPEMFAAKYEVLKRHCADIGRDPSEIEAMVNLRVVVDEDIATALERRERLFEEQGMKPERPEGWVIAGDPDAVAARIREYEALGAGHFVVTFLERPPATNAPRDAGAATGAMQRDMQLFAREVITRMTK